MIPEEELTTWEQYKALIDSLRPMRGYYLFRGVSDAKYDLLSTFDRMFHDAPADNRSAVEIRLINNFRKECEHYTQFRAVIDDDDLCLALAQHHGLPTRLMDWTASSYVAAYFAFQGRLATNPDRTKNVEIWILNKKATSCWCEHKIEDHDPRVRLISPAAWHNERLQRQAGWFTLSKALDDSLNAYIDRRGNPDNALRRVKLPALQAESALSDLDLMGINARELFDDLQGAARNAYVRTVLDFGSLSSPAFS